jgi:hypothetical protein
VAEGEQNPLRFLQIADGNSLESNAKVIAAASLQLLAT